MAFERRVKAGVSDRDWYVANLRRISDASTLQDFPSSCFVLFLSGDSRAENPESLGRLARHVLQAGAVYVCCHGTGCERLHDIFDEIALEYFPDKTIMTTWHEAEPIEEALEFAIESALPDEEFVDTCRCGVILNESSIYENAKIDLYLARKSLENAI